MEQRPSDVLSNEYTIKVLTEQLRDIRLLAMKWGITFEVKIATVPEFCINVLAKNGGKAFFKNIPLNDVIYYADDPNELVNQIADATYNALLKDMLRDELRDPLKKAIINCTRMANR